MVGKAIKSTFDAWINKMPPSRDTLHVKGKVEFPTSGYKAELVEAEPQGVNPSILILDVRTTPPTGPVNQVITQVALRRSPDTAADTSQRSRSEATCLPSRSRCASSARADARYSSYRF